MTKRWRLLAVLPAAFTAAAMIATPLAQRGSLRRRVLADFVVNGSFMTTTALAASRWGGPRAMRAAIAVSAGTAAVEVIGSRTGFPFGRYRYTDALQPQVAGVPVAVPLAWSGMALPAREVASAVLGVGAPPWARVAVGSAALTAWDLFLDPQMVGEGYWTWRVAGRYQGIPVSNYAGWFVTGLGVMGALERVLPARRADPALVGAYAFVAVMETLGFAAFFRDRTVALVGGLGMVPIAAAAVRRVWPTG